MVGHGLIRALCAFLGEDSCRGGVRTAEMFQGRSLLGGRSQQASDLRAQQARREEGLHLFFFTMKDFAFIVCHVFNPAECLNWELALEMAGKQNPQVSGIHVEPSFMGHGNGCYYGHCFGQW